MAYRDSRQTGQTARRQKHTHSQPSISQPLKISQLPQISVTSRIAAWASASGQLFVRANSGNLSLVSSQRFHKVYSHIFRKCKRLQIGTFMRSKLIINLRSCYVSTVATWGRSVTWYNYVAIRFGTRDICLQDVFIEYVSRETSLLSMFTLSWWQQDRTPKNFWPQFCGFLPLLSHATLQNRKDLRLKKKLKHKKS